MGNQLGYMGLISDDEDENENDSADNERDLDEGESRRPESLPVIRLKPNLEKFQSSEMYEQIRARCGLSSETPKNFNLVRALQQRENGFGVPYSNGSFSSNLQRNIANAYVPNYMASRLLSLDSKLFLTKFNKEGSRLLTATQDGKVRLYDASRNLYPLLFHLNARDVTSSIIDADFSPDNEYIVYSTWSRSFCIMPVDGPDSWEQSLWIEGDGCVHQRSAIFSVRYSPTGDQVIGGTNHSSVVIANVEMCRSSILKTHTSPEMDVNAVAFLNDRDPALIVAGCDDGLIKVFDIRHSYRRRGISRPVCSFVGHYDGITYIDSRNDGHYFLTNSKDQSIKIWDLRKPANLRSGIAGRRQQLTNSFWDYRWDHVPREFYNPTRPLEGDSSIMTYRGHRVSKTLQRAKFSPLEQTGQRFIYTGCSTGRIIIYDVLTGRIKEVIDSHRNIIRDLDWHPVRPEIVSGSWDTHVHLNSYKRGASKPLKRRYFRDVPDPTLRRSRRLANRQSTPNYKC